MSEINPSDILENLPYSSPFRFVDEITSISDEGVEGSYTFKKDEVFYKGHFKDNPVTPGVILTEVMAQIGLGSLGIFLIKNGELDFEKRLPVLSSSNVEFFKPVLPGQKVNVSSQKKYFRFGKLKCNVKLYLSSPENIVCKGELSGIFAPVEKIG